MTRLLCIALVATAAADIAVNFTVTSDHPTQRTKISWFDPQGKLVEVGSIAPGETQQMAVQEGDACYLPLEVMNSNYTQLDKADVTLELDTKHAPTLFGGDLAAVQKLFFGGELKIDGNVMASNKLTVLQGMDPKLVDQARDKRLASGQPDTAAAGNMA